MYSTTIQRQIFKVPTKTQNKDILIVILSYMIQLLLITIICYILLMLYRGKKAKLAIIIIPLILTVIMKIINYQLPFKIAFI
jgi:hypothetical protein